MRLNIHRPAYLRSLSLVLTYLTRFAVGQTTTPTTDPIVIDTLYTTIYSHETVPGNDPGLLVKTSPNIPFVKGDLITESINSTDGGVTPTVIGVKIAINRNLQTMDGGGCGVTDSAAISLQDLKDKDAATYEEIMDLLFSQDDSIIDNGGAALSNIRSPLGASDFAGELYSYDDTTDCSPDLNLTVFTIEKAPKLWATQLDALKRNPSIDHFFAPWSPPAWMKQPESGRCSMIGGQLKEEFFPVFAEYLARSMQDIKVKLGKEPFALSIQNEPGYLPNNYPGNLLSPAQAAEIGDLTRKALDQRGINTGLTVYDFNWDGYQDVIDTLDLTKSFNSISWHCYGGRGFRQQTVSDAYPQLPVYMTECTVITQYYSELWKNLRTQTIRLLIDTVQYGSSKVILWNCVLQSTGDGFTSPTLPKVCKFCSAPVLIRSNEDGSLANDTMPKYTLKADYVVLKHLERATRPRSSSESNAIRTGTTTTEEKNNFEDGERVRVSAFKTPLGDGKHRYSLILLQKNDHFLTGKYENTTVQIGFQDMVANITLPCGLHTLTWVA